MERFFHEQLHEIRSDLILMGRKTIDMLQLAVQALVNDDPDLVNDVLNADDGIDELNKQIDSNAIKYLTMQSPVAGDVRLLAIAMKAARELERTADEAASIAKRVRRIAELGGSRDLYNIPKMADMVLAMLGDAVDSFVSEDANKAAGIPPRDEAVDRIHKQNYNDLNNLISSTPNKAAIGVELLFVSKSLEREGDHAANMGEEVVYLLQGKDIRHIDR